MDDVKLELNEKGRGQFYLGDREDKLALMEVGVYGNSLVAYHTEVAPRGEGQGLAKKLLAAMVEYARKHQLKVTPLCAFVHAQFNRHPELYNDIWNKESQEG